MEQEMNDLATALEGVSEDALEVFALEDDMPEKLVQAGKEIEFSNLEWFKVYNWVRTIDLPEGAKIRDTTWALKRKGLGVRARLCLRDFKAMDKKLDGVFSPTPTPLTVRVILFLATILEL